MGALSWADNTYISVDVCEQMIWTILNKLNLATFRDNVLCKWSKLFPPNLIYPPPPEPAYLVSPRSHSLQTAPCPASGAPPDHSPPQTDSDDSRSQTSHCCFLCPWWRTVGREEEGHSLNTIYMCTTRDCVANCTTRDCVVNVECTLRYSILSQLCIIYILVYMR